MSRGLRFSVYGLYELEIERKDAVWRAYRVEDGKRRLQHDVIIPDFVGEEALAGYLDDLLHEQSPPGGKIERIS